jgi:hypothetical protein
MRRPFGSRLKNIVGDVALCTDKMTGQNGELGVIVHDGGDGTGAPLHIPIVNQYVGRSLSVGGAVSKGAAGAADVTRILPYPMHLSAGEDRLYVEVAINAPGITVDRLNPYVQVCTTANVEEARVQLEAAETIRDVGNLQGNVLKAYVDGLVAGDHLVFINLDTTLLGTTSATLLYCRIHPHVGPHVTASPELPLGDDKWGLWTPAAGEGLPQRSFDAIVFANLKGVDGYVTGGLNHNANNALEAVTGAPAGGNLTEVQADTASTNPVTSRHEAHTRSAYANEGEVDFPIWCEAFGSFLDAGFFSVNEVQPPTSGMLSWYAPWPITTALQSIASNTLLMPDFQTAASRLKAMVLLGSSTASAAIGNWTVGITTPAGSATATGGAGLAAVDGTNRLWLARISAIPFTPDAMNKIDLTMQRAGAKAAIGEVCVLGIHLYFDP